MDNNYFSNKNINIKTGKFKIVLFTLLNFFAIYLSFKINKGFQMGSFFVAFLFSPIYIIYVFAVYGTKVIK
jgi:hypothetical protein